VRWKFSRSTVNPFICRKWAGMRVCVVLILVTIINMHIRVARAFVSRPKGAVRGIMRDLGRSSSSLRKKKKDDHPDGPLPFKMSDLVELCKRRGFVFQSSEIYAPVPGFFDYGTPPDCNLLQHPEHHCIFVYRTFSHRTHINNPNPNLNLLAIFLLLPSCIA